MTTEPARLRARRIRALTVMSGVAAVVLAADAISKAQVLARLPGHPPVRLLHGLITLELTFNAGAAFATPLRGRIQLSCAKTYGKWGVITHDNTIDLSVSDCC